MFIISFPFDKSCEDCKKSTYQNGDLWCLEDYCNNEYNDLCEICYNCEFKYKCHEEWLNEIV